MTTHRSVLVVEDDDWFAEQHVRTLKVAGFSVSRVPHGLAAIEPLDRSRPDILVLDIFLPGPNAMTLIHELQSYADLASIPIILCSNGAGDIPHEAFKSYGVRTVLDKARMRPDDLVTAVRREL